MKSLHRESCAYSFNGTKTPYRTVKQKLGFNPKNDTLVIHKGDKDHINLKGSGELGQNAAIWE